MIKLSVYTITSVLILWLLWAFHPLIKPVFGFEWDLTASGQWGDTFGALNALFAAFGCAAVVLTLRLQQQQIRDAQNEQHRQRFESSYFELVKLLRETRNEARFRHTREFIELKPNLDELRLGPEAFKYACLEVVFFVRKKAPLDESGVAKIYEDHVHWRYESSFGPYFRVLYTILYRIQNDRILTQGDRHRYGNLLRSQLTGFELALAGLNGLSSVSKDFGDLLTDFRMFKYLPPGSRRKILELYYDKQAFAARD